LELIIDGVPSLWYGREGAGQVQYEEMLSIGQRNQSFTSLAIEFEAL
jgi:hypothetical protein